MRPTLTTDYIGSTISYKYVLHGLQGQFTLLSLLGQLAGFDALSESLGLKCLFLLRPVADLMIYLD